jgi:hypothetical protein
MPTEQPQGCGGKPKTLAIGIAPLGIISIGIVPMGVVSIGVVPMGVLSIGAVGMGVINACVVGMGILVAGVNVMGVWWAGVDGMGPKRLGAPSAIQHHHHSLQGQNLFAYPSKQVALQKAAALGCQGVHAMGSLWMPCEQHPDGAPTLRQKTTVAP